MQNAEKFCITNSRRTQKLWEYGLVPMILWEITTLRQETPHRAILVSFFFLLFHFNHCLQTNKHLFSGPFFHSKCAQRIITNCTFSVIVLFWCSACVGVFSLFVCLQIFKCDWCWCCFCTVLQLSEFFAQMVEHCETEHTYMPPQIFLVFFQIFLVGKCIFALVALVLPFLHCARAVCVRSDLKIGKRICLNWKLYLSQFVLLFLHRKLCLWLCVRSDLKATDAAPLWLFPPRYLPPSHKLPLPGQVANCICQNPKLYSLELSNWLFLNCVCLPVPSALLVVIGHWVSMIKPSKFWLVWGCNPTIAKLNHPVWMNHVSGCGLWFIAQNQVLTESMLTQQGIWIINKEPG